MFIKQIYTGCLAEASYFIESQGEALVIDPIRDIEEYLHLAKVHQTKIKYVFLTHLHADFMAGHQDLADATNAKIVVGPTTLQTGYKVHKANDNEVFMLGNITLKVLHTPGHTTESICLLLFDEKGKEHSLFSGDTLFIGDVGRPDLAQKVIADLTQEKLAKMLFHSLRNKIMTLPDDVVIYPNHGAGSPCGKNISTETYDTLGNQKKNNYALRPNQTEDEFVAELLDGLTEPPQYFPQMVLGNLKGVKSIFEVRNQSLRSLTAQDFEKKHLSDKNIVIIDTRIASEFISGYVPGSINIELDSSYAIWSGTILRDINTPILLVAQPNRQAEAVDRLARVGFDNVLGYLEGGFESWKNSGKKIDNITLISTQKLIEIAKSSDFNLLDVRKKSEYDSEHIIDAQNYPVDYWWDALNTLDVSQTYYVHCKAGSRSAMFISILKNYGFHNLINIREDFDILKTLPVFEISDYVCPTTFL